MALGSTTWHLGVAAVLGCCVVQVAAARQEVEGQGGSWAGDPQFGVFVLHNKQISKQADLPDDILNGRYFFGETSDNVQIAYPFST
ncbi:uncharacterized protein HaLaN_20353, partial [Haematococcus lacustris]